MNSSEINTLRSPAIKTSASDNSTGLQESKDLAPIVYLLPLIILLSYKMLGVGRFLSDFLGRAGNAEAEGSVLNQIILACSFFLASWIVLRNPKRMALLIINNKLLILFLFYTLASCFWSPFPVISFKRWIQFAGVVLVGMVAANSVRDGIRIKSPIIVLLWITGISSFISIVGVFIYPAKFVGWGGEWIGLFTNKNLLGAASALAFPVWLSALNANISKQINKAAPFILIILLILIVGSRSATAVAISFGCFLMFAILRAPMPTVVKFFFIPIPMLTTYFFFLNFQSSSFSEFFFASLGRNATLSGRTALWESMIAVINEHLIWGIGYNGFWVGKGLCEIVVSKFYWHIDQSHNGYLDILNELGIVGFLLFLFILIQALVRGFKSYRDNKSIGLAVLLLLFSLILANMVESSFCRLISMGWIIFLIIFTGTTPFKVKDENKNIKPSNA